MGFFSKLGRTLRDIGDPGGTVINKATGGTGSRPNNLASGLNPVAQPKAPTPPGAFDPGQRTGASINGQSGVDQPSMRLGWTNGGYQYHNSPFNQAQGGQPPPQAPPPNMGFGGASMGASGPQQMLQGPGGGGSMPPAGAQSPPMGPPTMQIPTDPQRMQAMMLRNRGMM